MPAFGPRDNYTHSIDALPAGKRQEEARPAAKHELWKKVASPKTADELLGAIRQRIKDYGYDPSAKDVSGEGPNVNYTSCTNLKEDELTPFDVALQQWY